jgi:hypothetical protein
MHQRELLNGTVGLPEFQRMHGARRAKKIKI